MGGLVLVESDPRSTCATPLEHDFEGVIVTIIKEIGTRWSRMEYQVVFIFVTLEEVVLNTSIACIFIPFIKREF